MSEPRTLSELTLAIYMLELPQGMDEEGFLEFMTQEVFPAVDAGSTRAGKVTGLRLFQGSGIYPVRSGPYIGSYIWIVEFTKMGGSVSPSLQAKDAATKLDSRGIRTICLGDYDEVATAVI